MELKYANGSSETVNDFEAALAAVRSTYPDAVAYHGGFEPSANDDVVTGQILFRADEDSSVNDDGANAVAEVA